MLEKELEDFVRYLLKKMNREYKGSWTHAEFKYYIKYVQAEYLRKQEVSIELRKIQDAIPKIGD